MQLYFIRHAQSANNALWDRTGASVGRNMDPGVTDAGRKQAGLLARFLSRGQSGQAATNGRDPQNTDGFGFTHLYSSLMDRAVYTASRIADALDLPVLAWEELHEEGGIYLENETTGVQEGQPGNNRTYFEAHYPRLLLPGTLGEAGWWNRPFEAYELRRQRAYRFLEELKSRHGNTDHRVAVVSHGGFYNQFMGVMLGLPDYSKLERPLIWFTMNNCAITRIDFMGNEAIVVYQNRADFLPREMIT